MSNLIKYGIISGIATQPHSGFQKSPIALVGSVSIRKHSTEPARATPRNNPSTEPREDGDVIEPTAVVDATPRINNPPSTESREDDGDVIEPTAIADEHIPSGTNKLDFADDDIVSHEGSDVPLIKRSHSDHGSTTKVGNSYSCTRRSKKESKNATVQIKKGKYAFLTELNYNIAVKLSDFFDIDQVKEASILENPHIITDNAKEELYFSMQFSRKGDVSFAYELHFTCGKKSEEVPVENDLVKIINKLECKAFAMKYPSLKYATGIDPRDLPIVSSVKPGTETREDFPWRVEVQLDRDTLVATESADEIKIILKHAPFAMREWPLENMASRDMDLYPAGAKLSDFVDITRVKPGSAKALYVGQSKDGGHITCIQFEQIDGAMESIQFAKSAKDGMHRVLISEKDRSATDLFPVRRGIRMDQIDVKANRHTVLYDWNFGQLYKPWGDEEDEVDEGGSYNIISWKGDEAQKTSFLRRALLWFSSDPEYDEIIAWNRRYGY